MSTDTVSTDTVSSGTRTTPVRRSGRGRFLGQLTAYDWALVATTVVAIIPVVWAVVTSISDNWTASADNAYFLLRARDVGTEHTPLLGTWTSTSLSLDFDVNNPGPMLFFLLAVPVKLGESTGLLVGAALINVAAIVGIAWALRRNAGSVIAMIGVVGVTGLGWTMGRTILADPWQPHSLIHVALLYLVVVWVTAAGDRWMLPFTVFVASLLVQTHISYVYLVAILGVVAVVGLVWSVASGADGPMSRGHVDRGGDGDDDRAVEDDETSGGAWSRLIAGLRAPVLVAVGVGFVCWLPSLIEQFTADGKGNLSRLLEASRMDVATLGAGPGTRVSARFLAVWPTWLRPSFDHESMLDGAPGTAVAILALVALVVVLIGLGGWAARRGDRFACAGIVVAICAIGASIFTASRTIETVFGVPSHHFRYLWPVAIMIQLAIAACLVRLLRPTPRIVAVIAGVLVAALAVANLGYVARLSYDNTLDSGPAVRAMNEQLGALDGMGTVLLDRTGQPFSEPFLAAMFAELDRRGIEFVVADPSEVRQIGSGRLGDDSADVVLRFAWGIRALEPDPDGEPLLVVSSLDEDELEEFLDARSAIDEAVRTGRVTLTEAGRRALADGDPALPVTADGVVGGDESVVVIGGTRYTLIDADVFRDAVAQGWVEVEGVPASVVERWVSLGSVFHRNTFAAWIVPTTST